MNKASFTKRIHIVCGLTVAFLALSGTTYGQVDSTSIEQYILRYTSSIEYEKLNRDTITTYSYMVLYDEQSELDTIMLSSMADSLAFSKGSMRELRGKYENLPSHGFNLKSSAIFVPVLIIPYGAYYTVLIDEKRLSTISGAWESLFFHRDLQIEERYIKFVVPTVVTVSEPME